MEEKEKTKIEYRLIEGNIEYVRNTVEECLNSGKGWELLGGPSMAMSGRYSFERRFVQAIVRTHKFLET